MLETKLYRGKWFIFYGSSRLSSGFPSREAAESELDENRELYVYWAGSAGVSIKNTPAIFKKI